MADNYANGVAQKIDDAKSNAQAAKAKKASDAAEAAAETKINTGKLTGAKGSPDEIWAAKQAAEAAVKATPRATARVTPTATATVPPTPTATAMPLTINTPHDLGGTPISPKDR
jgi:hypothetical protein